MLAELFREQVRRTPQAEALRFAGETVSYEELRQRVSGIAAAIREALPTAAPTAVGLLCAHGPGMIAAILGVLEAGHIYVPLSTAYPDARLRYILQHSNAGLLLHESGFSAQAARLAEAVDGRLLDLAAALPRPEGPAVIVPPDQIAYILYTSGSTGNPKGVPQTHENVVYYIRNWTERLRITAADRLTLFSSFCHDGSVQDMFGALLNGALLLPYHPSSRENSAEISAFLQQERVTIWHSVPSLFSCFVQLIEDGGFSFPDLRLILLGGEPLREHEIAMAHRCFPGVTLGNVYGQTESSVDTIWLIDTAQPFHGVVLGEPLDETRIFLVGREGDEVEEYEIGEILVASRHITPGYWRDPETSAQVFRDDEEFGRLYWTGDLGRMLPGGLVEFMGRRDFQIKIRGFRVEPGEVESALLKHPAMREAVVTARSEKNDEIALAAYYTLHEELSIADLRAFLADLLPDYMIPAYFMPLDRLPLTANGKVDRKALPQPSAAARSIPYVAPRNGLEEKLVGLWSTVLERDPETIGIDDNFFEIGGHSLKAVVVTSRIRQELEVPLPMATLLQTPTIRGLAETMERIDRQNGAHIPALPKQPFYELSSVQRRLYVLHNLEPLGTEYNITYVTRLRGRLDKERVLEVFSVLSARHDVLRTSFCWQDDRPVQVVHETVEPAVEWRLAAADETASPQSLLQDFVRPFDLHRAPLWRARAVQLDETDHLLAFDIHHILADGTSLLQLIQEFMAIYGRRDLPTLPLQYRDFAAWQNARLADGGFTAARDFWCGLFADGAPLLDLPGDFPRPPLPDFRGRTLRFSLKSQTVDRLRLLALQEGVTDFAVFFAVFSIWLGRLSGSADLVVGTPVAGRMHAALQYMIGMFVNTLALRCRPEPELTFRAHLRRIKELLLGAFEHQEYPFEELLERIPLRRDTSRNPLFDVMFIFQNIIGSDEIPRVHLDDLHQDAVDFERTRSRFDLTLTVLPYFSGMQFALEYATALFRGETVALWVELFRHLASAAGESPDCPIADLDWLPAAERRRLLAGNEAALRRYAFHGSVSQLFTETAARHASATALHWGDLRLSYAELQRRVCGLTEALRDAGLCAGGVAAIWTHRGPEMVVAQLAVLQCGAAYLPLDGAFPAERVAFALQDSGAGVVLAGDPAAAAALAPAGCRVVDLTAAANRTGDFPPPSVFPDPASAAYLIYTSGSTGRPKGVVVEQRQVVHFIQAMGEVLPLSPATLVLCVTSLSFDIFVLETLLPLCCGAAVVLAGEELQQEPQALADWLPHSAARVVQLTPSRLKTLHYVDPDWDCLAGVDFLVVGGESFPAALLPSLQRGFRGRVFNVYGPTETTVWSSVKELTAADAVTIGRPLANTRMYVVDDRGRLCPAGIPGEIWIGGSGVARGYHRRDELTADRFQPDPFVADGRVYRSGDLGRVRGDGEFECLGRLDNQVKVRGYRVELEEVEARLQEIPGVEAAAAALHGDPRGDAVLCAYVSGAAAPAAERVKALLAERLPEYMVPAVVMILDHLPLLASGKVDRKALPSPQATAAGEWVAPAGETEERLARLWSEVLGLPLERIGAESGFFDLGGHSLAATMMTVRVHREMGVRLPLREVFRTPRLRPLARYLHHAAADACLAIPALPVQEHYALSSAQRRLYILQQLDDTGAGYHIPFITRLRGPLQRERVEAALTALLERHESLRTSFPLVDEHPVQVVHERVELPLDWEEGRAEDGARLEAEVWVRPFIRPFALHQAPLWRVKLVRLAADDHLLLVDMHHIIGDGLSLLYLVRDFLTAYAGGEIPVPAVQYKEFAAWQNARLQAGDFAAAARFWQETFADDVPVLELPADHPRPAVPDFAGATVSFSLSAECMNGLRAAAGEGVTDFMVLLAVFAVWLSRLGGQEDLVVGTPVAGRTHADLHGVIGMFVNTLALRVQPRAELSFRRFLAELKERLVPAFEYQEYPFETLVEQLPLRRDTGRNPLFDVMFVLQNMAAEAAPAHADLPALRQEPVSWKRRFAKFDLTLTALPHAEGYHFTLEYASALFREETIARWLELFCRLAERLAAAPDREIADIELISAEEKQAILSWNEAAMSAGSDERGMRQVLDEAGHRFRDLPALCWRGESMSHGEFQRRADRLAAVLQRAGAGPGTVVAIWTERCPEMMLAMVAALKSGAAYLPLDARFPLERVDFAVRDCGAAVLLVGREVPAAQLALGDACRVLDLAGAAAAREEIPLLHAPGPHDGAYIIYTSGSTGRPKGVMVEQGNVVNFIRGIERLLPVRPGMKILGVASLAFDIFVLETVAALALGMTVVLVDEELQNEPQRLIEWLPRSGVQFLQLTPSRLKMLYYADPSLAWLAGVEVLATGGEPFAAALLPALRRDFSGRIFNMYGPTETTVYCTGRDITEPTELTVGPGMVNTRVYVVDRRGRLQPPGLPGEIWLGGDCVARGYIGRDELTAARFFTDPWVPGGRIYASGDVGRLRTDGELVCLGRLDHQVKVRGYRIELEEVEARLQEIPGVAAAAAAVRADARGDAMLCAYICGEAAPDAAAVRAHLGQRLPEYMVPAVVMILDRLPLLTSGKVDRKALPEPRAAISAPALELADEWEKRLAELWSEVLSVPLERIGADAHFFDLGGHSLAATVMSARVHREWGVRLPLVEVFRTPQLRTVADFIRKAVPEGFQSIPPAPPRAHYALTPAQQRLFALQQFEPQSIAYNISQAVEIPAGRAADEIAVLFRRLIERHESLRTSFFVEEGQARQRVHVEVDFQVECASVPAGAGAEERRAAMAAMTRAFLRPFDLGRAPLLRVGLWRGGGETDLLLVDQHHIITDRRSQDILIGDFLRLGAGGELPPLRLQYKDYAEWFDGPAGRAVVERQERFWLERLADPPPPLLLPLDFPRPAVQSFQGDITRFVIAEEEADPLRALAREAGATLQMVMLAAFHVLLHKVTGAEDIVVGSPAAGRSHADLQNIVGLFVNTLAMRQRPEPGKTFRAFLQEVRDSSLQAYENQDYPFDALLKRLGAGRDRGRNPLFDVMFEVRTPPAGRGEGGVAAREARLYTDGAFTTIIDQDWFGMDNGRSIHFVVIFCRDLFRRESVERLTQRFREIVSQILADPDLPIGRIAVSHDLIAAAGGDLLSREDGDFGF